MKTLYDLLELPRDASVDDIKRAFRREIAKYHPDKVQHLGAEFQEIAEAKAAALTQAYKTLTEPESRAAYDAQLTDAVIEPAAPARAASPSEPVAGPACEPVHGATRDHRPPGASSVFASDRAGAQDLVRRATVARFRQALHNEFGPCEESRQSGFEVACAPRPSFWKMRNPPHVLGRFVAHVDAAAIAEAWGLAARMRDLQRDLCLFLLGPSVAPAGELATAIAAQRRRTSAGGRKLVLIPVNTATWNAHVPTDAPPVVKSLLSRVKAG